MIADASQEQTDQRYLGAVLEALRLRLEWFASGASDEQRNGTLRRQVDDADRAAQEVAQGHPAPAAALLVQRLGLQPFEHDVLILCAAVELDASVPRRIAVANGDPQLPHPTFALALSLFDQPSWDAVAPTGALRRWRLVELTHAGRPLTSSPLRADERIVSYLKGLDYLDSRLEPLLTRLEPPAGGSLPGSQEAVVDAILTGLRRTAPGTPPVVQLCGPDGSTKDGVAARAAAALGRSLYALDVGTLPLNPADLQDLARLWHRESLITPVALYLDAHEGDIGLGGDGRGDALARFLDRSDGVVFLGTREGWSGARRRRLVLEVDRPIAAEQRQAWTAALGDPPADPVAAELAAQFNLDVGAIDAVARTVLTGDEPGPALRERLWDGCLSATRPRMDELAQRVDARATWDDIVLPEPELALLRRIASQVRHRTTVYDRWGFGRRMNRGLGISALFTGPSGTGKTMAAEVIANELRLALYRIDLSAVVSKYIGETEKNLRRLFDAAEEGGALLFFDEADALFGKRSEVKDSHDRYANIEVNYLLQRMEAYRGIAILATNMKSALDQAFMRRIRFIVSFPFPQAPQRRLMWEKAFPDGTPTNGLDPARLAELPATGGTIANVALNAAFSAAALGRPVSMALVLDLARTEFRKLELPVVERQFGIDLPIGVPT